MLANRLCCHNGILPDDAAIVFNFNVQLIIRQYPITQIQNLSEPFGIEPMIDVGHDMRLNHGSVCFPGNSAAIDEPFRNMSYFSHMRVSRDMLAVRKYKTRKCFGMLT